MCEYELYVGATLTLKHPTLEQAFAELSSWTYIFVFSNDIRITWSPMRTSRRYYVSRVELEGTIVDPIDRSREILISVENVPTISEKLVKELMAFWVATKLLCPKPKHEELKKEIEDIVVQVCKESQ
jgi:hypothetical protein